MKYEFLVTNGIAEVTIVVEAEDPNDIGKATYTETVPDPESSIVDRLKDYIKERGGMVGAIDPDECRPLDLDHALTTEYSIDGSLEKPYSEYEYKGPKLGKLPTLPEGAIY
jgi:hypothetical protein